MVLTIDLSVLNSINWATAAEYSLAVLGSGAFATLITQVVRHLKGWTGSRAKQVKGRIHATLVTFNGLASLLPYIAVLHASSPLAAVGTFGAVFYASQLLNLILTNPLYKKYSSEVIDATKPDVPIPPAQLPTYDVSQAQPLQSPPPFAQ